MNSCGFSVVVPVFNEGASLRHNLERLHACLERLRARYPAVELVVVDDGSSDETPAILARFAAQHPGPLTVLTHPQNRGLSAALETGCRVVRTPYLVTLDADLSYAPETVEPLIERLIGSGAAIVLASPYMPGGSVANVPFARRAASWGANRLLSWCVAGRIKTFTGMVRAYETEVLLRAFSAVRHGEFNASVVADALRGGKNVIEIPARLCWPDSRRANPPRLSVAKFLSRVSAVLGTAGRLLFPKPAPSGAPVRRHA